MKESPIAKYLKAKAEAAGAFCRRVEWINKKGCPDFVVMLDHKTVWVETKGTEGKLSISQTREHSRMLAQGAIVATVYSFIDVDSVFLNVFDI